MLGGNESRICAACAATSGTGTWVSASSPFQAWITPAESRGRVRPSATVALTVRPPESSASVPPISGWMLPWASPSSRTLAIVTLVRPANSLARRRASPSRHWRLTSAPSSVEAGIQP